MDKRKVSDKVKFFLSYSRIDSDVAEKISVGLKLRGHDVFQDTLDIPYGVEWRSWIQREISRADSVLFIVTRSWLESINCREELDIAVEKCKRLLPVVFDVELEAIPTALSDLNLTVLSDITTLDKIVLVLEAGSQADYEWVIQHRQLLINAEDWQKQQQKERLLLKSATLYALDAALADRAIPNPKLSSLQLKYVEISRRTVERRRKFQWLVSSSVAVIIAMVSVIAWNQNVRRIEQEKLATARKMLVSAEQLFKPSESPQTALQIAITARGVAPVPEIDDFLRKAFSIMPVPTVITDNIKINNNDEWWEVRGFSYTKDFSAIISILHDGRRNSRIIVSSVKNKLLAQEIKTELPKGWFSSIAPYGGRAIFQPGKNTGLTNIPGEDPQAIVYDLPSLNTVASYSLSGKGPLNVGIDANGRYVALGRNGRLEVWDIDADKLIGAIEIKTNPELDFDLTGGYKLSVHPNGHLVTVIPGYSWVGYAPVWSINIIDGSFKPVTLFTGLPNEMVFSPDGKYFAVGDDGGEVRVFEIEESTFTFREIRRITLDAKGIGVGYLAFSKTGLAIAVVVRGLEIFEVTTAKRIAMVDTGGPLLFGIESIKLWTSGGQTTKTDGEVLMTEWFLPASGEYRRMRSAIGKFESDYFAFDFLPDTYDIIIKSDGVFNRISVETGDVISHWHFADDFRVGDAVASLSDSAVIFSEGSPGTVSLTATTKNMELTAFERDKDKFSFSVISPDGQQILAYTLFTTGPLFVTYETKTGRKLSSRRFKSLKIGTIKPIIAGEAVVLVQPIDDKNSYGEKEQMYHQQIVVFNSNKLTKKVASLLSSSFGHGYTEATTNVRGTKLYLFSDESIDIYSLPNLQKLKSIIPQDIFIHSIPDAVTLSYDEKYIAIVDHSNIVRVLDQKGDLLARFKVRRDAFGDSSIKFSHDGKWLAVNVGLTDQLGSIYSWKWQPQDIVEQSCARIKGSKSLVESELLVSIEGFNDPCKQYESDLAVVRRN